MRCSACGTENRAGRKFCAQCAAPLAPTCPVCGALNEPGDRFCGECATPLVAGPDQAAPAPVQHDAQAPHAARSAERRLVSILFADLVGFTTLSEARDAEEVRELLTRYFDTCRQIISRYGGTVEKFIGDAVMAVWGTPVAQEDDAERAVRAALDLTAEVSDLGEEVGAPELRARAGVLTGEAAVTIGAEGQGMVAGDLVNTASRIQSVAEPGSVWVGEATRRASEAAIVYEDAGTHQLKGKAEPIPLWRALRVVAARGGAQRAAGLEAPFVGRDREMRLVKELFHGSAEEGKAHLVSVVGTAGIGKSRLSWEFEKYGDGLVDTIWWHRGRCLAYGEGVAYWALAEMVRSRSGILEGEGAEPASAKLRAAVEEHLPDPEERRWVEPRLAHLLGLEERTAREPEDLFSAWRLFFERLAEKHPTVMVFEDIQWADAALLDFIEYLLEWSKDYPMFILTLARPELMDRRSTWGAGKRNFTSLFLEALPPRAMEDLLRGLVPGLPDELRSAILDRAEGVPLYAVETVRMLLDRGLLVREGNEYRPAGPIEALDVPETLQALIAARLDGLSPDERRLLQDASVLGKTFSKAGAVALTGLPEERVQDLLTSLVRKEMLFLQADPRSPERGQYGFLQDLVKRVAYDTMAKRDRKARHLAAAHYLEQTWSDVEEIVEVVATHYTEAYRAAPDAPGAAEIKARAGDMLARAGERAASLAASDEAGRYFEQAIELADSLLLRAELHERAGTMAWTGGRSDGAESHFEQAVALFESEGATHPAARVAARLGEVEWAGGRLEEAVERMETAFEILAAEEPDADLATFAAQLARLHFFKGDMDLAYQRNESALAIAESLWLPEMLSQALNTKGVISTARRRHEEAVALLNHALRLALDNDIPSAAMRAYNNLGSITDEHDRYDDALEHFTKGLVLARRIGDRFWERLLLSETAYPLALMGRWDEVVAIAEEITSQDPSPTALGTVLSCVPRILVERGEIERADPFLALLAQFETSADLQDHSSYLVGRATVLQGEGRFAEVIAAAEEPMGMLDRFGVGQQLVKDGFVLGIEAALSLGDLEKAEGFLKILEALPPGEIPPFLQAQTRRLRARLDRARDQAEGVEAGYKTAGGMFRELGTPFWLAVTLLERGEWLSDQGRADDAEPLRDEARGIFERLRARPWLDRLDARGSRATAARATAP